MTSSTGFAAIPRVARVTGRLRVPGDKSISHRYAMLAALADGESRLTGYAPGPAVPSAQVKSAVLLAGLHADGRTSVKEPTPTRDHTERALEAFGGRVIREADTVAVDGGQRLRAITGDVPGDISSALFWLA